MSDEMHDRVTQAILPAFDHIQDKEYRLTIAGCWARAAIETMLEPTPKIMDAIAFYHIQGAGGPSPGEIDIAKRAWKAGVKAALR